ncbi:TetR/AcrR family transcriptional regulator [Chitinimonas sp.]|uniref:TetR/AcrR family transcriptional regulator n=1 Tax=Chitinimonas sp. TaxID=1934313 RepID=UPI002F9534BF
MTKRGRPASFDRDEALQQAMQVFWEYGYEGASMTQLREAMGGLCAPSLYAAFGSKEALFREAVARYRSEESPLWLDSLQQPTARAAIETMLRNAAICYSTPGKPRGCLIDLGGRRGTADSESVQAYLRECRLDSAERIRQRLLRGMAEGDLPATAPVEALTTFYATVLQGLSVQACDGATREAMLAVVDCAMGAWQGMVPADT